MSQFPADDKLSLFVISALIRSQSHFLLVCFRSVSYQALAENALESYSSQNILLTGSLGLTHFILDNIPGAPAMNNMAVSGLTVSFWYSF